MELTHGKTMAAVASFAQKMRAIDSEKNVAILLPASSAAIMTNMAVMLNGQTAVNLNFTTSVAAVQAGVRNAAIKTVYTSEKFIEKLKSKGVDADAMLQGLNVIYLENLKEQLSKPLLLISFALAWILPAYAFYRLFGKKVGINDAAAILFSSGSEGTPKGIVLSHRNFMANIKQISDVLKTRDTDVIMGSLPPFHSFGLTVTRSIRRTTTRWPGSPPTSPSPNLSDSTGFTPKTTTIAARTCCRTSMRCIGIST
jgi:acyl-[acyl-carrier-protein]-phospholipid O-acyltransferase/long-chain-fatty-acid--[acyl-carrier-protein] ligase